MRITMFLLLVCVFCTFAENTHSQNARVNIHKSNVQLENILNEIENQTDYLFIYNHQVNVNRKVSVKAKGQPVSEVLNHLFADTDVDYSMEGTHIVLSVKEPAATFSASAPQQQIRTVSGVVKDSSGEPIIGVNVIVQGTTSGTVTDFNGQYTLTVPGNHAVLVFSYLGYKPWSVQANREVINVTLQEDTQLVDEVVIVGYGVQKKENLTGAVATVDVDKALGSKPVADVAKSLQGITPGLTVTYKSGNLGGDATINIRGIGTIIDGKEKGEPLILVDGVPSDLTLINPEDIAHISVLKDAASASIYGTRGAFGVVLITTKKGQAVGDKVKFSYSTNLAFSKPTSLVGFVDPEDELPVMMYANNRTNPGKMSESFGMQHDILLAGIKNWKANYAGSRSTKNKEMIYGEDWEIIDGRAYTYRIWDPHKEMLRDWTPQQTHNFSAQGRMGEKSSFMVSLGYVNQSGFMRINTDKMKRYNANVSMNTQLTSWLKASVGTLFTRKNHEEPYNYYNNGITESEKNGYFGYYMRWGQYFPYGTYDGKYFRHAPGYMAQANMNNKQTDMLRLNASLIADITKDLQFVAEYSINNETIDWNINGHSTQMLDFWTGDWDPNNILGTAYQYLDVPGSANDKIANSHSKDQTQVFNAYATYSKQFEDHGLKVMAGTNIEKNDFQRFYLERRNVMDPTMPDISLTTGSQYVTSSSDLLKPAHNEYAIAGFFGRVNYDYKGKYLLELNGRYDGSSNFPVGQLWGFFPSGSVGYRLTEESFMEGIKTVANDIKIRASVGSIGNQNVMANAFRTMMDVKNAEWVLDGATAPSVESPSIADPKLTWEKVITYDVGLDVRFLNNMFTFSFDWYQRNNNGVLAAAKTLPQGIGASAPLTNAGDLRTRGYEISVDFTYPINKHVQVYANVSMTDYQTEVTKWDNQNKLLGVGQFYEGMKIGEIWGFETDRLFQANDFNADGTLVAGIPDQSALITGDFSYGPGDVKYKDLDGDGKITTGDLTADNPGDLKVIGNTTPRYQYSFRLGANLYNFDIDVFFQGVGKRDYWADSDLILPLYNRTDALYEGMLDYWTESNTNAYFPNPYVGHSGTAINSYIPGSNNFVSQSRYLLSMAYLRLKNVTIGYTLPLEVTRKAGLDKVRVYFSGQNLAEFKSSRLPVDPEINETEAAWGRTYPYPRTVSVGLQVNF
ncbi:MAG: TonB-dependent receptor [Tannerellaceae bacterium]|nr:TonB-dependent receptor [Tannerellaceae bacterium]